MACAFLLLCNCQTTELKYGAYIPEQIKNSGHFIWSHEDGLNAISSPGKKDQTVRRITLTVLAFDLNGI